jgi:cell division protease FtsH
MDRKAKYHALYWLIAIFCSFTIQAIGAFHTRSYAISFSDFQDALQAGELAVFRLSGSNTIQAIFKEPDEDGRKEFTTTRVDPEIARDLHVRFYGTVEGTPLRDLFLWLVPSTLAVGGWVFWYRHFVDERVFGGLMSIGRSKAKVHVEADTKVRFDDLGGTEEAKDQLREMVAFLKDTVGFGRLGGRAPKGLLLVGPPGTGKTLLARATAGEAGVPLVSIRGCELVEIFAGYRTARLRDLFEQARRHAPAILFIDELDAIGRASTTLPAGRGLNDKEQWPAQLLVELDAFDTSGGMVLLAATNRPEILDPALLRAGRLDQVIVDRPEKVGRRRILDLHCRAIRISPEVDLDAVAGLTPGFSGADLAGLVNQAALLATRRGADAVTAADFTEAIERAIAGPARKSRLLNSHERDIVTYHAMGHALLALSLPGSGTIHKMSIIPRGNTSMGYSIQQTTEDRLVMTRQELENQMTILLGGRAAEHIVFGELSTSAADDLQKVTEIARSIATRYGMTAELGQATYDQETRGDPTALTAACSERGCSEETAREIDLVIKSVIDRAFCRAVELLKAQRQTLEEGARLLAEHETLQAADLSTLRQGNSSQSEI